MTIIEKKKELRKQMLTERASLDLKIKAQYDQWICEKIWADIVKGSFQFVHCYLPMGSEVNIFPLIEKMLAHGITVVMPKTLPKRQLQHLILHAVDELEKGVFGTRHPANAKVFTGAYDLIIVPGLAFDHHNFRLGYGGGYYDHFLVHHHKAYKLGICYPFQVMEAVPLESHDVQLDGVLYPGAF